MFGGRRLGLFLKQKKSLASPLGFKGQVSIPLLHRSYDCQANGTQRETCVGNRLFELSQLNDLSRLDCQANQALLVIGLRILRKAMAFKGFSMLTTQKGQVKPSISSSTSVTSAQTGVAMSNPSRVRLVQRRRVSILFSFELRFFGSFSLFGWAPNSPIRTKNTAITFFWCQSSGTLRAAVEMLTSIGWHFCLLGMPTFWTRNC